MMIHRRAFALLSLAWALFAALPAGAGPLYVALNDQSFTGVALFNPDLSLIDQIAVTGPVSSLAAGPTGSFYISRNNSVVQVADDGTELDSISASASTVISDMAFAGNELDVALTDQSFDGIARLTSSLGLINQFSVSGSPTAVGLSLDGTIYTGIGNSVVRLDGAGNVLGSVSGSATTMIHDLSFFDSTLYVGLSDGAFNGVALFTPLLGLIGQRSVDGPVAGLAGGPGGTFYIGTGNRVLLYSDAGSILDSVTGSATTQIIDLDFALDPEPLPSPVPEPATGALMAAGLALTALLRARRGGGVGTPGQS